MRKTLLSLLTFTATISLTQSVSAQTSLTDTTSLQLGRLQLKKEFTQSIRIKGEDLERMPFTTLSDAINSWTYGVFANSNNLMYVIDGNLANDVNAYSIQDIKEITLVQNALVQINGADKQQQLVLITTRQGGARKQGLSVSGQDFLTNQEKGNSKDKSSTTLFHQYNVTAWKSWSKVQIGASVNYLHAKTPVYNTLPGLDAKQGRFRITAWMNAQLSNDHELYVQLNTSPQNSDGGYLSGASTLDYEQKNFSINPTIGLRSRFLKGLSNELSVSYLNRNDKGRVDQMIIMIPPTVDVYLNEATTKTDMVLVRENLRYTATANNWRIEPAVNLTFRYLKSKYNGSAVSQTSNGGVGGPIIGGPNPPSYSYMEVKQEGRLYLLTPSLGLSYKSIFNLQGGILANISSTDGKKINRVFPFVNATVNVLPPNGTQATSLQVFGSYAKTDNFGDVPLTINQPTLVGVPVVTGSPGTITTQFPDSSYWNWQIGTRIGFWHDRLSVNYNFEKRDYTRPMQTQTPIGTGWMTVINYPACLGISHHININAAVVNTKTAQWRTGITATHVKTSLTFAPNSSFPNMKLEDPTNKVWTGGWVNRLTAGHISAGLDLLYNFNKDSQISLGQEVKVNALTIQNVYFGYRFDIKGIQGLELYASVRNLAQHYRSTYWLGGNQEYYGLGFKADM